MRLSTRVIKRPKLSDGASCTNLRLRLTRVLQLALATLCLTSPSARAGSGYIDTGLGGSLINYTDPFFVAGGSARTSLGFAFNVGAFASLYGNATEFQLGIINRATSGMGEGYNYALDIPYATFRLQLSRIYGSIGYSPIVAKRASQQAGWNGLSKEPGASALYFEGGVLYPVIDIFSLGAYGAVQKITSPLGGTPPSVYEGGVFMRFYFTVTGTNQGSSNEFKGWRYPFGRDIW